MIIGLVLLGSVAALLFFGIAKNIFNSFGIAYWLAFIMLGVMIGAAFIPTLEFFGGALTLNVAGFIAPLVFAVIFFVLACRRREGYRAAVGFTVTLALYTAIRLVIAPLTNATVTVVVSGFLCGAVAYLVAKTELASVTAVFAGLPIAEIISSAVERYVSGAAISLGSAATFDAVIAAAVFAVVLYEAVALIKRTLNAKRRAEAAADAEIAEEFDPDEYKRYFDE